MARFIEQHFENQTVALDHAEYDRCTFKDCEFVYKGSIPVHLNGSRIEGGTLTLSGEAANTLEFFAQLRKTGLRHEVRRVLGAICQDLLSQESG